jgi:ChpA-C
MKTWVRKTLSVGVLAAGALLFAPGAAFADVSQSSADNNGILNGTQIVAPVNVPLNIVGNAIGVAGEANATGAGSNWWTESGSAGVSQDSSKNNGILNGSQAYVPVNVPINIVGNAVAVLGKATASGAGSNGKKTESAMTESVSQDSSDNNGIGNGTQLYAPVDIPVNVCGNSLALLGSATAQAMCTNGGTGGTEGVTQSSSDNNGIGNGTQVYAPVALPVNLAGNSLAVLGSAKSAAMATNESGAAGSAGQDTSGNNGIANGTQVAAPVTVPVNICGNALGILGAAHAAASCTNGTPDTTGGDQGDQGGDNGNQYGGDQGDQGYTAGDQGDSTYGQTGRRAHGRHAGKTEASAVDGLAQTVGGAGGLNVAGLDLLNTLR